MFSKDWRLRVDDILEAIDRIRRYTHGLDEAAFCADDRTVDAVVRNLEIIGEAAKKVPHEIAIRHPDLPWHRMADVRNVLVHEYHSVDPGIVWSTVHHDLPPLVRPLRALLRDEVG